MAIYENDTLCKKIPKGILKTSQVYCIIQTSGVLKSSFFRSRIILLAGN